MQSDDTETSSIAGVVQRRDWFAVVIDLSIVVVGVFLGLQVQEWNARRIERNLEQNYIERLAVDFTNIEKDLARCQDVYRSSLRALNIVSDAIHANSTSGSADTSDLSTELVQMTAGDPPAGRSSTFVEMLSTGDLGLIRDTELRAALTKYDEYAQTHRDIWRSIRSEIALYNAAVYGSVSLKVDLDAKPMSSIVGYDLEQLSRHPNFSATFNVLAGAKANLYELCTVQRGLTEQVRRLAQRRLRP